MVVTLFALQLARPAAAQDLKANGEKVYADQKCSLCYSVAGKGNARDALDGGVGTKLSDMLPKDDVAALFGYRTSLKKSP